ncbi:PREDICTED: poly(A) RNA polymerase gld-2 homolog A [Fragaria vesca subsp. vesca]|uniref:poly(A) RNA polymerase gld-2 homolog A n=1 Tax=Fragaria vesca subsp. vesca TaxID=101020 RepID=UPI0002C2E1DC|nr:PREDICTED: poly(A) RNA polymerase gld-2 homolog A [Fragaria vesca subsp. vesca]XP_011469735.1 PREDICTED: poly(A) RNA polymerase gld-2 homolog A [Fragaria vesca subsp. vesca]XP_011469736.1 PREDICTED: poly(A) RNA polymerase gld-2 homolog A [Fragaria vesca subsp. vesca]
MENTLKVILRAVEPSPTDREIRWQILRELQGAVESVESLRGATVEPFGSFVSELFTRWGDLDVSIEFSKGSCISSHGKKHTKDVLRDVMKAMRVRGGWNLCQFIPRARVPILMVKSKLNDISCDISVNNLKAQMKSKLLLWINDIDPRFHDMVLLVKEWAKAHNINNSKSGTFNSYSLSLLVVFHFQTCAPAILPPLQDIYRETLTDDLKGLRDDAERRIESSCVENIRRFKASRLRAQNKSSLSELFISFLRKFSGLSSKAAELGICTYSGKWEAIESNMGWLPKTYCILVEDPFDRPENTARGVSLRALNRISGVFEMSRDRLIAASYSSSLAIESSLLTTLVRPQTLNHIMRNLGYNIENHQTTHPQHIMAESSHSRTTRHYNGPPKPNGPYRPYVPELVPPRDYHNRPQKLKGPYVPVLESPKNYSGQQKPTGPYVRELVDSSPQVHQQLRKSVQSSSQVKRQIQKPMHSSPQVKQQIQKPAHSSSQEQPLVRESVHSTSQVQSPLQKKKKEKAHQSPLQKMKPENAPMLQTYQEWRPKKPGMQL